MASVRQHSDSRARLYTRLTLVSSTHDQQALLVRQEVLSEALEGLVHSQDLLDLRRDVVETVDDLLSSGSLLDRVVRELDGDHDERDILRGVCLGRSDTNLGTGLKASADEHRSSIGKLTLMWTPL